MKRSITANGRRTAAWVDAHWLTGAAYRWLSTPRAHAGSHARMRALAGGRPGASWMGRVAPMARRELGSNCGGAASSRSHARASRRPTARLWADRHSCLSATSAARRRGIARCAATISGCRLPRLDRRNRGWMSPLLVALRRLFPRALCGPRRRAPPASWPVFFPNRYTRRLYCGGVRGQSEALLGEALSQLRGVSRMSAFSSIGRVSVCASRSTRRGV